MFCTHRISCSLLQASSKNGFDGRCGNMTFNSLPNPGILEWGSRAPSNSTLTVAALPSHKEKKRAEIQFGLGYTRSPPWILHQGETHVNSTQIVLLSTSLTLQLWNIRICSSQHLSPLQSQEITNSPGRFYGSLLRHWAQHGNPHIWPRKRKWKIQIKEMPKSWEMRTAHL